MKRKQSLTISEVRAEQVANAKYETIKIAIDWHAREYRVVRIIDGAGPEPAQRFNPSAFLVWVQKQQSMAQRVYCCYEAGAGGFELHRQLTQLGVTNYLVTPRRLDVDHRGVQTDATDARQLAMDLDRYVRGNPKALRLAYVPSPEAEQRRQESRQREQLRAHRLRLATQGRSLLLGQGWCRSNQWWRPVSWLKLIKELPVWLREALAIQRRLILAVERELQALTRRLEKSAPALRPVGVGALSLESIRREVCDWGRFGNRKRPGSYAGLCGGVSATGRYRLDLAITKAGNSRLRRLLIECAWRMVIYQPQSRLIRRWRKCLLDRRVHRRVRKKAIVAVARQLLVELWRWETGRRTPEQLGWKMSTVAGAA